MSTCAVRVTTVVVFVPVVFLEGIAAQLFRDMAVTVSLSLLATHVNADFLTGRDWLAAR